jgi:predicted dehydrogenase
MAQPARKTVNLGMIGVGGFGSSGHMLAYTESPHAKIVAVCDAVADRAAEVAAEWQVGRSFADYRELLAMPDVEAVDVCTPNFTHKEIALAALSSGKHVICEKPLALSVADARAMERAARAAGTRNAVNFVHRYVPSARYVKQLIDEGALGQIYHVHMTYAQGWLTDPNFPRVWRLNKAAAGSGTLGDIGIHAIDLVRWWLNDEVRSVAGRLTTFRTERPAVAPTTTMPSVRHSLHPTANAVEMAPVDVDDEATWLASFNGGAQCVFFTSRNATARSNYQRAEIYGSDGAVTFDNSVRGHLQASLGGAMWKRNAWATIDVPAALMREDRKNSMHYFVQDIATGSQIAPTFHDGVRAQEVLAAVEQSAAERRWLDVDYG